MVRRSPPRKKIDDARFPVRIRIVVPPGGFGQGIHTMNQWLNEHVGADRWARHSDGHATAFYFFEVRDANAFLAAHPELQLVNQSDT